jgi:hypothetical protein
MAESSIIERALALTLDDSGPLTALAPPPAAPAGEQESSEAALRRCRAAWRRAFDEYMKKSDGDRVDQEYAAKDGAKAYRSAMPLLAGYQGIRDFIACTAYGILIGAIPPDRSGQLLYAAQVAAAALPREPKPSKPS